jgi:hypothetical protein
MEAGVGSFIIIFMQKGRKERTDNQLIGYEANNNLSSKSFATQN